MGEGAFGMDQDLDNADYWFCPVVTDTYEANCAITEATRPPRRTRDTCKSLVNSHTLNSLFLFHATFHSKANCHSQFIFDMQRLHSADPWLFCGILPNQNAWHSQIPASQSSTPKIRKTRMHVFRPGPVMMGTCVIWRDAALQGNGVSDYFFSPLRAVKLWSFGPWNKIRTDPLWQGNGFTHSSRADRWVFLCDV